VSGAATDARPRAASLVVGVGSTLRSDDAAGRWVAEGIAALALPDVEVRVVHQLTPELAAEFLDRDRVVVVDASVTASAVTLVSVLAADGSGPVSHHQDLPTLLATVPLLGGRPPTRTLLMHVPVVDLGFGEQLSAPTARAVSQAIDLLSRLLTAPGRGASQAR
jgi:hydrogenase maturation protease